MNSAIRKAGSWRRIVGNQESILEHVRAQASAEIDSSSGPFANEDSPSCTAIQNATTVWLTLEQIQLVGVLLLFGSGVFLRKSL